MVSSLLRTGGKGWKKKNVQAISLTCRFPAANKKLSRGLERSKMGTSDFRAQLPIDNDAELFNHGRRGLAEFGIQM